MKFNLFAAGRPSDTQQYVIAVVGLLCLIGVIVAGLWIPPSARLATWLLVLALLIGFLLWLGKSVTGNILGILISSRNRISLSRLQVLLWTVITSSALAVAVLANIQADSDHPLKVAIPLQLWILMGISTGSLIGSPLVLSTKNNDKPTTAELEKAKGQLPEQARKATVQFGEEQTANSPSVLLENIEPTGARWDNLFTGEEIGNGSHVDISRVQMFLFTLVVATVYVVALGRLFLSGTPSIVSLPEIDQSMDVLLAISHTGYLGGKGLKRTKLKEPDQSAPS